MELHGTMQIRLVPLLVLVALVVGCSGEKPQKSTPPREVTAPVKAATRRPVVECRSFPAEVESQNSVTLASKVSGAVESVLAREGDALHAGQLIMRIDDKDLTSQEQGLVASKEQISRERQSLLAKASLAKTTMERMRRLLAQRVVSQEDFDKAQSEYESLTRQVEAAAAQENTVTAKAGELAALRAYTRITAPFDGILARRYVDQGAFVTAGSPLALVDQSGGGFELAAQVDESLLAGLRQGQTILAVVPALAPAPFVVTVSAIVGRVDPASRTFKLKCALPDAVPGADGPPRAGMFGRVFVPARTAEKLLLPETCLAHRGDLPTVAVVGKDDILHFRVVKTGATFLAAKFDGKTYLTDSQAFEGAGGEHFVDVLSGLADGERVACDPGATLREGDRLAGAAK
ncbi:efflux transporter, RND family, MFP subunit [Solidesulfovibrio fructosivorans JJ]]|uniref:Efflux transporter, RND family, MFP subunit n=1 Tax=Solidesulfovibrio fructosivorans JJ] TaxID=596151 RepID=E1JT21_SOLFR|nr:efflux RND transporter periplasmic adaptor subunit [Solidesulfovibrio fructosivorans]EFL52654.1 efflux transporter, RND family, MFP subunit [Solidesulfovibrio fructosivorans JJ]]